MRIDVQGRLPVLFPAQVFPAQARQAVCTWVSHRDARVLARAQPVDDFVLLHQHLPAARKLQQLPRKRKNSKTGRINACPGEHGNTRRPPRTTHGGHTTTTHTTHTTLLTPSSPNSCSAGPAPAPPRSSLWMVLVACPAPPGILRTTSTVALCRTLTVLPSGTYSIHEQQRECIHSELDARPHAAPKRPDCQGAQTARSASASCARTMRTCLERIHFAGAVCQPSRTRGCHQAESRALCESRTVCDGAPGRAAGHHRL